jgi:hypothetical protein
MKDIKFKDGRVYIDTPKKPKKITGTRFGAVLEANKWQTPFQAWCEITKAYVKPFEGTIYTEAGKVIEDKQLTWFSRLLPVVRPEDVYGKGFFERTFGDFFPNDPIFGGMWDSLVGTMDDIQGVIECKTTKRAEDWVDDVPEYYALQAALYATLMKVDDVYMIATFLDEGDYEHPEEFVCNSDNTTYVHFKVSERYPKFQDYIDYCTEFWYENVLQGVSPLYDEKADKEYLDALRTVTITDETDFNALVKEAEDLYAHIAEVEETIKADKKRLSEIEGMFKKFAIENETEGQTKSVFQGSQMTWTVTKSVKKEIDKELMQKDGVYDKYLTNTETYTIRKTANKGE